MADLRGLCADADRLGKPVVGVVFGEPGSGKTRLLTEVRARLGKQPQVALTGFEAEADVPLAAARELLGHLATVRGHTSLLDRMLFPAPPVTDTVPAAESSPLAPLQLFEGASAALRAHGPLVAVVDDLQWVDRLSLALLHYLLRAAETRDQPLAILAASRTSHSRAFIDSLRRNVAEPSRVVIVELGLLDDSAAASIVKQLAPELDQRTIRTIVRRAGGSPFWLETLTTDPAGTTASLVDSRMSGADADAAFLLSALALAGEPLALEEVSDLRDWSTQRAQEVAADLVSRGLARERHGALSIAHDLIREAVTADVPPATARLVHRRLAKVFERQVRRNESAADLQLLFRALDHRRSAGQPMMELAFQVAHSRGRRMLGVAGLDLLLDIADKADPSDPRALDLKREIAALAGELGQHEVALKWWSVLSDEIEDPVEQAAPALAASEAAMHLGRTRDAWAYLRRAETAASLDPAIEVAMSAQEASLELWLEHRPGPAWDAAARAVQHVRGLRAQSTAAGLGQQTLRAYLRALLAATEAGLQEDRPADVLVLSEELARAAAGVDERTRLHAVADGGLALRWLGRNTDAEHRLRRAWEDSERELMPQARLEVGAIFARVIYSSGLLSEAVAVLTECRAIGDRLGEFCPARPVSIVVSQLVEHSIGSWQRAASELLVAAGTESDPHSRQHGYLERAMILARLDPRRSEADIRTSVALAQADAVEAGCQRCLSETSIRCAEALARIGAVEAREMLADYAANVMPDDTAMSLWARQAEAAITEATGDPEAAIAGRQTLSTEAATMGFRMESLWLQLDLAASLAKVDRGTAAEVLRAAGHTAEAMGAHTEQLVADQALRALGVRTWRRSTDPAGSSGPALTERELEVARLAAGGASNPEIAAALFLSRKTVERHISNSLAKLGLRNRVELAAALESSDG